VSPVKYDQEFYIPEDGILHSDRCKNLKSYCIMRSIFLAVKMLAHGWTHMKSVSGCPVH
jgi:hypothetical protein